MRAIPCIPEDPADKPFELFIPPDTAIGQTVQNGTYVVIGRKLWETEQGEMHIESLMVRKVAPSTIDKVAEELATDED